METAGKVVFPAKLHQGAPHLTPPHTSAGLGSSPRAHQPGGLQRAAVASRQLGSSLSSMSSPSRETGGRLVGLVPGTLGRTGGVSSP